MKYIQLIIGSILGGLSRYLLAGFVHKTFGAAFPYGTMAVNLTGCLLIGFLSTISEQKLLGSDVRMFLIIGFCGAFTTFSTFMLETSNLIRDGEPLRAFMNVTLSVFAGFILFRIGVLVGEII